AYELQRDLDEEELLVEDLLQRLGEVRVPTLVVVGEEDQPDMHAIAQRLERRDRPRAEHGAPAGVRDARAPVPRGDGVSTVAPAELVARIWERDPTLWTGG